ncbi:hypothetical protein EYF80_016733 [Liparis tanakae]|uniref:Uncharacterized protein n=1 Tax=Liparis tanakae TaxID=230148 RepID=A0A4Z2I7B0_9TELE|nr:hypothetical protein EYF80_016733 [Liparis tanakae]
MKSTAASLPSPPSRTITPTAQSEATVGQRCPVARKLCNDLIWALWHIACLALVLEVPDLLLWRRPEEERRQPKRIGSLPSLDPEAGELICGGGAVGGAVARLLQAAVCRDKALKSNRTLPAQQPTAERQLRNTALKMRTSEKERDSDGLFGSEGARLIGRPRNSAGPQIFILGTKVGARVGSSGAQCSLFSRGPLQVNPAPLFKQPGELCLTSTRFTTKPHKLVESI